MELMIAKMGLEMMDKAFNYLETKAKENNMTIDQYYKDNGGDDFFKDIEDIGNLITKLPEGMKGRDKVFIEGLIYFG